MSVLKLGVDLDGVMWDLLPNWLEIFSNISGFKIKPEDVKTYKVADYVPESQTNKLFYCLTYPHLWREIQPIEGAVEYLEKLSKLDIEIYIITSTDFNAPYRKFARIFELFPFLKKENLIMLNRKELIDVDILVDDNPANFKDNSNLKRDLLVFDRHYNQEFHQDNVTRIKSWEEIYDYIMNKYIKCG